MILMTKIIAFVGMPASGKSEAAKVVRMMGIPVISMGDAIRKEVTKRGLKPTDENTGGIGTMLRQQEGMDAIAKRCLPTIRSTKADVIVIDGVRNIEEVGLFKKEFSQNFILIAINTPFEIRFERIKTRGRSDDMQSGQELKKRDEREISWGLDKAIEKADIVINNTGSLQEFTANIEKFVSQYLNETFDK